MGTCSFLPEYIGLAEKIIGIKPRLCFFFQQPELFDRELSPQPYPAQKTGPICQQGQINPEGVEELIDSPIETIIENLYDVSIVAYY